MVKASSNDRPWLKAYPEGVPAEIKIPAKSLPELFNEATERFGDKTAVIFYGKKISFKQLRESADRFATALHELGVTHGAKVALLLPNSPQFIIAYFGVLKLGATLTPISPLYTPREIKHQLNDSEAKSIICLDLLYENVEKIWKETELKNVIITSISEYLPVFKRMGGKIFGKTMAAKIPPRAGIYQFQELIEKHSPNPPKVQIDPKEDLAVLSYTGGTTGLPKGAMLSHFNIVANVEQLRAFWTKVKDGQEIGIAVLPFYHIYGQSVIMISGVCRGQTLVVFSKPDLDGMLSAIEKYRVTLMFGVPALYKYLIDRPRSKRVDWKILKFCTSGADALHRETADDWKEITNLDILEGYGLTETSPVTHGNPVGKVKIGSFGVPIPSTMATLAHLTKDRLAKAGDTGELVIKGPQVMKGYWNRPEETKDSFITLKGEAWFRTGDIARMDEEGYFYMVDRKKDMIKYKGYSVYPREIEEVIYNHPRIKEAAVIGVPNPEVGERIKAVVVPESDYRGKVTVEDVQEWCKERLAHYKIPHIVEFRGEIPKTDVGKADHRKLREEAFRLPET